MNTVLQDMPCPRGHLSTDADYCSECGARMGAAAPTTMTTEEQGSAIRQRCPDCGTVREREDISFCEVCGFNFITGARGEIGVMPVAENPVHEPTLEEGSVAPAQEAAETAAGKTIWSVVVTVDPSLRSPESPEAPAEQAPRTIELLEAVSLIGRLDEARGILPEVPLPVDEAVSRRHALLQQTADGGLVLRDIGSANGTQVNGVALEAMTDRALVDGDQITLGHWSRIAVESRQG